jgi:DNA adenine methylase
MQYMGGKFAIAGQISGLLRQLRVGDQPYLEPFVGGCNIVPRIIGGVRIASDANPYLITMYKALQAGWEPPQVATKERHAELKQAMDSNNPETAFYGFARSFGGDWFGGFTDESTPSHVPSTSSVAKQLKNLATKIADVTFTCCDYRAHDPHGMLIYCDPPYANTTSYKAADAFDHDVFWQTMREWSKDNTVCISEYVAPPDFVPVWQQRKTTGLRGTDGKGKRTIETVFMHESQARVFKTLGEQGDLL